MNEYNIKPRKVITAKGWKTKKPDSIVGFGESIVEKDSNGQIVSASLVDEGKRRGIDDVYANTENAAVVGNDKDPFTGIPLDIEAMRHTAALDRKRLFLQTVEKLGPLVGTGTAARSTADIINKQAKPHEYALNKLLAILKFKHDIDDLLQNDGLYAAKCGKDLPKYAFGADRLGNLITSGLGVLGGIGQIISANGLRLNSPEIYSPNQYERQSLTTLAGLRDNPYNQLRAMLDVEARNRYAISQSGGLTGAQKYLANVAGGIGLLKNYADILYRSNEANNKYKAAWASAAMQAGLANAQRMQQSNQYRDEAYARSHAAREQMRQMGMQNILGQVQQYYSNEFNRNQFNRMMDLYWAEQDAKHPKYNIDDVKKNVKFTAPSINDFMNTPVPKIKYKPAPLDPLLRMTPSEFKKYFG